MHQLIYILDLAGTVVFAITGALAAGKKEIDVFGVVVLGCVTALGGGTLRDLILGARPIFWIADIHYLTFSAIAAIATFVVAGRITLPKIILMYGDAVGLSVFTIIGFQKGLQFTHSYSIGIVMGVMTGVVGGMIRDVLSGDIPLILRKEIYASASLGGAVLLVLFYHFEVSKLIALPITIAIILAIRIAALHWNLSLPLLRLKQDGEDAD